MITVEASDPISALDLVERLGRYSAHSSPLEAGAHEVVIDRVPAGQLRDVLEHVTDWADAYGLDAVALRLGAGSYRLRLQRPGGLSWHDVN